MAKSKKKSKRSNSGKLHVYNQYATDNFIIILATVGIILLLLLYFVIGVS
jgi:hypothetical protein